MTTPFVWVDGPFGGTPVTAANLNAAMGVSDAAIANQINTPASQTTAALNATYAPVSGSANYAAIDQPKKRTDALDVALDYGAKGDGVILLDLVATSGSAVVTSAAGPFTSQDAGKILYYLSNGNTIQKTTITSVQSSTQATLTAAAPASSMVIGGPNANAVFGTPNATAFTNALADAQAGASPVTDNASRYKTRRRIYVPSGIFLIESALPPLTVPGIEITGSGQWDTRLVSCENFSLISLSTFNAGATDSYGGTATHFQARHLHISNPLGTGSSFEGTRIGAAIQDNGSGDVHLEAISIAGYKYGFAGAYGSDFSRFGPHTYFASCDVAAYLGPGSQQLYFEGGDVYRCREGFVFEGAPHFLMDGYSFEDPLIAAITFDAQTTGTTRMGVAYNIGGATYTGSWTINGTWFESNAGGSGRLAPRMIWHNGTPAASVSADGLCVRDSCLVSGGTQVSSAFNCFVESNALNTGYVMIDNLKIRGNFINWVFRNSNGSSATSAGLLANTFLPSGVGTISGGGGSWVIRNFGDQSIGAASFTPKYVGGTGFSITTYTSGGAPALKIRNDVSSTMLSGFAQAGAVVGASKSPAVTVSGAVVVDASAANFHSFLLQANATSSSITNPSPGQTLTLEWRQDATGSRTYAWPSNCKFAGGAAPSDTTASWRTSVTFVYDSGNSVWVEIGRAVAVR